MEEEDYWSTSGDEDADRELKPKSKSSETLEDGQADPTLAGDTDDYVPEEMPVTSKAKKEKSFIRRPRRKPRKSKSKVKNMDDEEVFFFTILI